MRLAEGKRIRSIAMSGAATVVATGVDQDLVVGSHIFQDDVTIVGAQISHEWLLDDADSNADGCVNSMVELSRQSTRNQPGSIVTVSQFAIWNALISVSGEMRKTESVMFPYGMGIEVDEGEGINLLAFLQYVGGAGPIATYANAILYYVER